MRTHKYLTEFPVGRIIFGHILPSLFGSFQVVWLSYHPDQTLTVTEKLRVYSHRRNSNDTVIVGDVTFCDVPKSLMNATTAQCTATRLL